MSKCAFPVLDSTRGGQAYECCDVGMSLRDYFAAKAMQALISQLSNTDQADEEMRRLGLGEGEFDKLIAKCAYDYADAMMFEREKI